MVVGAQLALVCCIGLQQMTQVGRAQVAQGSQPPRPGIQRLGDIGLDESDWSAGD